jgi:serine/threonine-protein kinase
MDAFDHLALLLYNGQRKKSLLRIHCGFRIVKATWRQAMVCTVCNKETPEGSRFCPFCGAKIRLTVKTAKDPLIGATLAGKYHILDRLGSGAMGAIYKATHLNLGKPVVLKVLHPHLLREEAHVQRFKREAKAASRLNQPNCITILDYDKTPDGWSYICMEFVEGKDLSRILHEEKKLSPERGIRIALQVVDALDEAHSKAVIHRDLKPENIMIERIRNNPDFVKVLDFGIAKIQDTSDSGSGSFKTATGMVFGTPEYMSPEQIKGEELDGRSDIYSLGVVIYQMLSGILPFTGETVLEVATKHLSHPPPPLEEVAPDLPLEIVRIVDKMLKKNREERFSSAGEVREALLHCLQILAGQASLVTPAPSQVQLQVPTKREFMPTRLEQAEEEEGADEFEFMKKSKTLRNLAIAGVAIIVIAALIVGFVVLRS